MHASAIWIVSRDVGNSQSVQRGVNTGDKQGLIFTVGLGEGCHPQRDGPRPTRSSAKDMPLGSAKAGHVGDSWRGPARACLEEQARRKPRAGTAWAGPGSTS